MKLSIQGLESTEDIKCKSPTGVLKDERDMLEAMASLEECSRTLTQLEETHTAVMNIKDVITKHGITPAVESLFNTEFYEIQGWQSKDKAQVVASLENVITDTAKKIWEFIKNLFNKIKELILKVFSRNKKIITQIDTTISGLEQKDKTLSWKDPTKKIPIISIPSQHGTAADEIFKAAEYICSNPTLVLPKHTLPTYVDRFEKNIMIIEQLSVLDYDCSKQSPQEALKKARFDLKELTSALISYDNLKNKLSRLNIEGLSHTSYFTEDDIKIIKNWVLLTSHGMLVLTRQTNQSLDSVKAIINNLNNIPV